MQPARQPRPPVRRRAWPGIALLGFAFVAAAIGHWTGDAAPTDGTRAQTLVAPAPTSRAAVEPVATPTAPSLAPGSLEPDLAFVDRRSAAYARFRDWVDRAVSGEPGYAFSAMDAALMYRLKPADKYCDLAIAMVEEQVVDAEAAIAGGGRPAV
ncbi:hypothetical protein, partial [Luteimonas notoginsengisoli]